ncbi:hypothetical protein E2C01_059053 [Portunus trituberculatus]|uniref:HTH CENPB-type domain-containing protein n=1 Tax=Portunus trituberculatus TaxID=210409 RepID=A0A5B7GX47_PORTR|nr:hypothetical protein [Portunus trituberculatus]
MPRTFVPKGERQTDRTALKKAFQYCVETGYSIREACKKFGMKVMTLQDAVSRSRKLSDGKTFVPLHGSPHKVFTKEQETQLCDYAIKIAKMFHGLPAKELRKLAYEYTLACKSPGIPWERERSATREWYYTFMARHPQASLKASEGMSIARAVSFNKHSVGMFFYAYIEAMEKCRFSPGRIINLDESSLSTIMKALKVVCEKGKPVASQISRERGKAMTFKGIISAGATGIWPVNRNIFPDEVYMRAAVTDQPEPLQDNDREDHTAAASPTSHQPSNATEEPVISVSIASSSTAFDCPPPLPSRDSSITTAAIPSTSSTGLSPEDIRPYPKAAA